MAASIAVRSRMLGVSSLPYGPDESETPNGGRKEDRQLRSLISYSAILVWPEMHKIG
jgi:hypothetical protein